MNTLRKEVDDLYDLKQKIESESFQTYIMKPLYEELDKIKNAYDCESLRELATIKGRKQGITFLLKLLKQTDVDRQNKKYELESQV